METKKVKDTPKKNLSEALFRLEELDKKLSERIADLHEVKGMMQARHAYCYYREYVWAALDEIRKAVAILNTPNL